MSGVPEVFTQKMRAAFKRGPTRRSTTGSMERMNLKEGDNVFAVTKATWVSMERE